MHNKLLLITHACESLYIYIYFVLHNYIIIIKYDH